MNQQSQRYYLQQMGIQIWDLRQDKVNIHALKALEHQVSTCNKCGLSNARKDTLFHEGRLDSSLMLITNDDKNIKATQLLKNLLESMGISQENIYKSRIVKCVKPELPSTNIGVCSEHLIKQIEIIKPKVIFIQGEDIRNYLLKKLAKNIAIIDIVELLQNPLSKKKAYFNLVANI